MVIHHLVLAGPPVLCDTSGLRSCVAAKLVTPVAAVLKREFLESPSPNRWLQQELLAGPRLTAGPHCGNSSA